MKSDLDKYPPGFEVEESSSISPGDISTEKKSRGRGKKADWGNSLQALCDPLYGLPSEQKLRLISEAFRALRNEVFRKRER